MPAMRAVNHKMSICRNNVRSLPQFGHSHKTGVGKRHWQIPIFLHELPEGCGVLRRVKVNNQDSATDEFHQFPSTARRLAQ
jgi:hypothetical protein